MARAVVFYSLEGSTQKVAKCLAKELGATLIELHTEKAYPTSGLTKFMKGGMDAIFGLAPKLKPYDFDDAAFDMVVLACPVWAGKAAAPMQAFLAEHKLADAKVGLAAVSGGGDASGCVADVAKRLGRQASELVTMSMTSAETQDPDAIAKAASSFSQTLIHGKKLSSGAF